MDFRLNIAGIAAVALASLGLSTPARAIPNCDTCVPAYEACLASGATDCDTRYAVCLRYCPAALSASPGKTPALPTGHGTNGKQEDITLVASTSPR